MITHRFALDLDADAALRAHRDGLPGFASDLPGLLAVTPQSRTDDGAAVILTHRWQGDIGVLPAPVRRVVTEDSVSWFDVTRWDPVARTGSWAIHVPILGEGPALQGVHRFTDTPGGCEVHVEAELTFVANADTKLLGMRLGPLVAPLLTTAIRGLFTRMVTESSRALTRYLEREGRRAA
jgi:hypothetical protein